ncbi:histidine triad protein [Lentzea sp. NBRC 105346]|uniref:HIT family protein n=1 Tax=Lentzea sp. NBRC 105346 TaxID=3032205 RepID=UPI0024A0C689|nr:HIT domain-containing protein [Lentzea sp. NBRC 105346]GLZ28327.1 histidine triad protein [Lentzea sp. NBRC 105346]
MTCPICAKHRGEGDLVGPVLWADDLVVVSHIGSGFPGYVLVETRRHVAYFDELTPDEVVAVARAAHGAARVLKAVLEPLFVFSCIVGRGVAHFHQHVFVRHPGTPPELDWTWVESPLWPAAEIEALCDSLRAGMTDVMAGS